MRPDLHLDRYARVDDFLATSGTFLEEREAEHNLILGICSRLRRNPNAFNEPPYLAAVSGGGQVMGVTIRTPPYNLILSEMADPTPLGLIVHDLAQEPLPGVVGPPEGVAAFAERWSMLKDGAWEIQMRERIFRLRHVVAPRPTAGVMRPAEPGDRNVLIEWMIAFGREALPEANAEGVAEAVDEWLAGIGRRIFLWDEDGPVSLVGAGGETPNGIRIGPVYTPPRFRGRGYASALTAAVSQAMLDEGRRFCFLYTDLANPTSNKIYQAIGYEPVTDALMVGFTPPRAA